MNYILMFYMALAILGAVTVLLETCVVCLKVFRIISGERERETLAARHP